MAFNFIRHGTLGSTTTSPTPTTFASNGVGNLLIIVVNEGTANVSYVTGVSDAVNGAYTFAGSVGCPYGSGYGGTFSIWYFNGCAASAGSNLVNVAQSSIPIRTLVMGLEYSGQAASNLYDTLVGSTGGYGALNKNISCAVAGELIVIAADSNVGAGPWTWTSSGTPRLGSSTSLFIADQYPSTAGNNAVSADSSQGGYQFGSAFSFKPLVSYTISGTILDGGSNPVSGVTVACTGQSSTTTDGSGNYSFAGLAAGTYTVTPTKTGWTFSPTSVSPTISSNTTENFTGTNTLVATPTFSPVAGSYGPTQNVTISSTDSGLAGFAITYTTDGTTPVPGSHGTVYSTPVVVASSLTLEAVASATGYANSAVGSAAYTINGPCGTPVFSPVAGSYGPSQSVTITSANSTTITYTTDGTTPVPGSHGTVYSGAITVSVSETIKAIGSASGWSNSAEGDAVYTINGACGTPTFSPVAGTYTSAQTVTISSTTAGASIYWNTTGSPTSADTLYTGPITVSASETVYAIAEKAGWSNSAVGSAAYVISSTPTYYSVPDCRDTNQWPNLAVNVQGTLTYTTPSVYSLRYWFDTLFNRTQPLPLDSRVNKPTDSRAAGNTPENSRTSGTFGPGE